MNILLPLFCFVFFHIFIYFYFWLRWVLVAARRPLTVVASPIAEPGLQVRGLQQSWHVGSAVVAHGL